MWNHMWIIAISAISHMSCRKTGISAIHLLAKRPGSLTVAVESAVVAEQHATWYAGGKYIQGATGMSAYLPKDYGYCTAEDESGTSRGSQIPPSGMNR